MSIRTSLLHIFINRSEEKCLVDSGLVQLLDKLFSLSNYCDDAAFASSYSDKQSVLQRISALAWAGFQVLSNRCVMWEAEEAKDSGIIFKIILLEQFYIILFLKSNQF